MNLRPAARKGLLTLHLALSVGWVGAVLAYLALGLAASRSRDAETVRGAWVGMELVGWWVILPLAVGALVSGLVLSVASRWGLVRHYWVLFTLVLNAVAVLALLLHLPSVSATADRARVAGDEELLQLGGDLVHAGLALVVLLVVQVLNVYKPAGLTPYGWRAQLRDRTAAPTP